MNKLESLKVEMLDYIKSYMLAKSVSQADFAEILGIKQAAISKTLGGKSSIAPVIGLYLAIGGEISGVKESKQKLVESFLSGEK